MGTAVLESTDFHFPRQTALYHGKVRDVYTIGEDTLVAVATDRISAFDVILPRQIPFKGQVLNQMAAHFLRATEDIAPNWLRAVPDPNASVGLKAEPVKIELVVRACLVGHAWREYAGGKRELCGVVLPDGLKEYDAFTEPIITPTTKAEAGHDQDISENYVLENGLATADEWQRLKDFILALFKRGQAMAAERGLLLADTKYEFGRRGGELILIDEVHTPDSSRYFYLDTYKAYTSGVSKQKPKHLSKEFVREWLIEHGFSGQAGESVPELPDDFVNRVSERYIELYEELIGQKFVKAPSDDLTKRIETNVGHYLEST